MNNPRAGSLVLAIALATAWLIPLKTNAASEVTFHNQSGSSVLVIFVGPTASSVAVRNGNKESVSVAPGHYYIKVRYGEPGAYSYSKSDDFDVTEKSTVTSGITIILHKIVEGNDGSMPISEAEYGSEEGMEQQRSQASKS